MLNAFTHEREVSQGDRVNLERARAPKFFVSFSESYLLDGAHVKHFHILLRTIDLKQSQTESGFAKRKRFAELCMRFLLALL